MELFPVAQVTLLLRSEERFGLQAKDTRSGWNPRAFMFFIIATVSTRKSKITGVMPLVKLLLFLRTSVGSSPDGRCHFRSPRGKMNSHDQAALLQDALLSFVTHVSSFLKLLVILMASSALMKDDFYFFRPRSRCTCVSHSSHLCSVRSCSTLD